METRLTLDLKISEFGFWTEIEDDVKKFKRNVSYSLSYKKLLYI